jgi:hypothetical protein
MVANNDRKALVRKSSWPILRYVKPSETVCTITEETHENIGLHSLSVDGGSNLGRLEHDVRVVTATQRTLVTKKGECVSAVTRIRLLCAPRPYVIHGRVADISRDILVNFLMSVA